MRDVKVRGLELSAGGNGGGLMLRQVSEEGREALEKPGSWVDPETTEQ